MVTVAPLAEDESASTIVRLASSTTGVPPEVYSLTGVVAITEGRFVDTGSVATVTVTSPGALATSSAVSTMVTALTPTPAGYEDGRVGNAAWYSAMEAVPDKVSTPVAGPNVPAMEPDPL